MTLTATILIVDLSVTKCWSSRLNSMIDPIARAGLPRKSLFGAFPQAPC